MMCCVVQEAVSLYMPGLSYVEMVTYAARLRMIGTSPPTLGKTSETRQQAGRQAGRQTES